MDRSTGAYDASCPETPTFAATGLGKRYATPVLQDVDFTLRAGEVHALMGANGAGKSTLARIISGVIAPDTGTMVLGGSAYSPAAKSEAAARGVQIVQQELTLIQTLSVAENLFLHRLPARWGLIRYGELRRRAVEALESIGLDGVDPRQFSGSLGIGQQQLVEIARALACECRVLILDEPTAALTAPQVDRLFQHISRLKMAGVSIVYISHRLLEVKQIADRVSILRDGKLVASRPARDLEMEEAVRLMVGSNPVQELPDRPSPVGPIVLRVDRISRSPHVRAVSFELKRGEVLGISGLIGSGRTELLRTIMGIEPAESGSVQVAGSSESRRFSSPRAAVAAGLGMIPEDRKTEGLLPWLSIRVNLTIGRLARFCRGPGMIDRAAERAAAESTRTRLSIRCSSTEQPVEQLSGGNQQKVVIGRWLMKAPEVILFDEPTRGIDIEAKFAVYRLIDQLAREGKSILIVSSELEELMLLCDRIAVMSAGSLVETFDRDNWTSERLMAAAFRGYLAEPDKTGA